MPGRLAPIAFLRGANVELNLAPVMLHLSITGATRRALNLSNLPAE